MDDWEVTFFHPFNQMCFLTPELDPLQDYWSLEHIGIKDSPYENDDDRALEMFNKTITFVNKRYYVAWPWKELNPNLSSNYNLALGRLKSLLKTFIGD